MVVDINMGKSQMAELLRCRTRKPSDKTDHDPDVYWRIWPAIVIHASPPLKLVQRQPRNRNLNLKNVTECAVPTFWSYNSIITVHLFLCHELLQ
jgi:hypothetical protein